MRDMRDGICTLCHHDRVIEACPADQMNEGYSVNLSVAETQTWRGLEVHGILNAYICQRCGYTQWFTAGVADIPIGPDHRTKIITGTR